MPRKKLVRRCEPRYGVSRDVLEIEAKYVAREVGDYLLLSNDDLNSRLAKATKAWHQADQTLEVAWRGLPNREQLALKCVILHGLCHLLELYCTHLGPVGAELSDTLRANNERSQAPSSTSTQRVEERVMSFSEWLFERGT